MSTNRCQEGRCYAGDLSDHIQGSIRERTHVDQDTGKVLTVTIRGVDFQGGDFDALEPANDPDPPVLL